MTMKYDEFGIAISTDYPESEAPAYDHRNDSLELLRSIAQIWVSCWPFWGAKHGFSFISKTWSVECCKLIEKHQLPKKHFHKLCLDFHEIRQSGNQIPGSGVKIW